MNLGEMGPMFGELFKQVQDAQQKLGTRMEELKGQVVAGEAGGGMVRVEVNGCREIISVKIDPAILEGEGLDMVEDLVVAACNTALRKAEEIQKSEIGKITGGLSGGLSGLGLDIPGMG